MPDKHVIVIGAGVLGLTSALRLLQSNHKVLIVARDLPSDLTIEYSSPWAGAHFRPVPITTAAEALEQGLVKETYAVFEALAREDASAGVEFVPGVEYFDKPSTAYTGLEEERGFTSWPGFRVLGKDELPSIGGGGAEEQGGITWGVTYLSYVINTPVYLAWLLRQVEVLGGQILRRTLSAIPEAVFVAREHLKAPDATFDAIVNASGMGFADPDCFPSRGQFLLVSNPCDRTISHQTADGEATVIIPRPLSGGTLIGGTKEPNNWSPTPSAAATAGIIDKVSKLYPQLLTSLPNQQGTSPGIHVLRVNVGRRPMRSSGFRIEAESLQMFQGQADGFKNEKLTHRVVHCYGAGGSGYKLSWAAARKVVELVDKD